MVPLRKYLAQWHIATRKKKTHGFKKKIGQNGPVKCISGEQAEQTE